METIKVVIVEPEKAPEIRDIPADLSEYQRIVGGYIECVYPFRDRVGLVCNEEGKLLNLRPNRFLKRNGKPYDLIAGTFFVVGLGEEDFASLTDEQARKYAKLYEIPDFLIIEDCGGIRVEEVKK